MITDEIKAEVWKKGNAVSEYPPSEVRTDACGAYMINWCYGTREKYAWEIDHIIPRSILLSYNVPDDLVDDIINLRPLNWHNNVSKGDDCPSYKATYTRDGDQNVEKHSNLTINPSILNAVLKFYRDKGYDIEL